ncbi:MAG TPA: hypothetical protein VF933_27555, partial [Streptosporangiaceae bacterium]
MTSTMSGTEPSHAPIRAGERAGDTPARAGERGAERAGDAPVRAHAGDETLQPGQQHPRFLEGKLQIPEPHFPVLRRRRISGLLDQAIRN